MALSSSQTRGMPSNMNFPATDSALDNNVIPSAGFGAITNRRIYSWIWGERLFVRGSFDFGTITTDLKLALGRTIKASAETATANAAKVGTWTRLKSGATGPIQSGDCEGPIFFDGTDLNNLYFATNTASNALVKSSNFVLSGERLHVTFDIPIVGATGSTPLLNVKSTSPIMAGMVMAWTGATIPDGWSEADGGALNIADYPEFYANLGSTQVAILNTQINPTTGASWAAPSVGQFRKPDYRGMVLKGAGTPSGTDPVTVGGYQSDLLLSHRHDLKVFTTGDSGSTNLAQRISSNAINSQFDAVTGSIGLTGGTENRVRNKGVRWIVKLFNESFYPLTAPMAGPSNAGFISNAAQTIDGDKTFLGKIKSANVYSGRWTPTVSSPSNISGVTAREGHFTVVDKAVTCTAYIQLTQTVAGTACALELSLPVVSDLLQPYDCIGHGSCYNGTAQDGRPALITPNLGSERALVDWRAPGNASTPGILCVTFVYILN